MAKFLISNNIRKLRFYYDEMTQQELAKRTGVTRQTIVAIENGKYSPTLESISIAMFLEQTDEVFSYEIMRRKGDESR